MIQGVFLAVWVRYAVFGALVLLCAFGASVPTVHGAVVRGGDYYELPAHIVLDTDLYFLGDTLRVYGTSTKDILAAGSLAEIAGHVAGDVTIAAGRVNIDGSVDGDVRVAGGVVTVTGFINEDLVVLAGNVYVTEDAYIAGDVLVAGDRLILEGEVQGEAEVWMRTIDITGHIEHDASFMVRESLSVRGDAVLGSDLTYHAPRKAFISDTVVVEGEVLPTLPEAGHIAVDGTYAGIMLRVLTLVVGSVLLVWLFPCFSRRVVTRALEKPTPNAVRGFVFLFALPVIGFVTVLSVLGVLPGTLILIGYIFLCVLALACTPIVAGQLIAQWLKKEDAVRPAWTSLGAITLVIITSLPLIGWLARALLFLLVFGTLLQILYESIWLHGRVLNPEKKKTDDDAPLSLFSHD